MNPAIVAPDAFDIVDISVEKGMNMEQRRNLGSVTKVLQTLASGKEVSKSWLNASTLESVSLYIPLLTQRKIPLHSWKHSKKS